MSWKNARKFWITNRPVLPPHAEAPRVLFSEAYYNDGSYRQGHRVGVPVKLNVTEVSQYTFLDQTCLTWNCCCCYCFFHSSDTGPIATSNSGATMEHWTMPIALHELEWSFCTQELARDQPHRWRIIYWPTRRHWSSTNAVLKLALSVTSKRASTQESPL